VQLTGRMNYQKFGDELGVNLGSNPFLAHRADVAARLLAGFLRNRATHIRAALLNGRLDEARKLVNGGSNGLAEFTAAFQLGWQILPAQLPLAA
jgi:predicted chitinase